MPVEGKEDTVLGIISFPWGSGCARTKSHCKRESVDFPDEALCLLHYINSNMAVEVLRGPAIFGTEDLSTIRELWVLIKTRT